MITIYQSKTASLFNAGLEKAEAELQGGDGDIFDRLEAEFGCRSIPAHLLRGFPYSPPYSCNYHTGGAMGAQLRKMCKVLS